MPDYLKNETIKTIVSYVNLDRWQSMIKKAKKEKTAKMTERFYNTKNEYVKIKVKQSIKCTHMLT